MLKPFFSEFDYIYERNLKKRMVQRRKEAEAQKKKLASTTDLVAIIAAQAEEDEEVDETGAWAHGAAIAGDEEEVQATAPALGDDDEDNEGAIELYNAPADAGLQSRAQDEVHEMIFMTSYEDLCRSHIVRIFTDRSNFARVTHLNNYFRKNTSKRQSNINKRPICRFELRTGTVAWSPFLQSKMIDQPSIFTTMEVVLSRGWLPFHHPRAKQFRLAKFSQKRRHLKLLARSLLCCNWYVAIQFSVRQYN
jgi:hypothetical protein